MLAAVSISGQSAVFRGQQVSEGRGPFLINGAYLAKRLAQLVGAPAEDGYEFVAKINRPNGPYIKGEVPVNEIHRQDFVLVSRAVP